ncbi:hypothetical protein ABB37_08242 [Leptomonas pyrrhocoris]|uniref:SMP-LTD domain-containing protein n=1 Tax=Leptomonas pyrrhocoris TaxID=157538 RepID=A0A0N0VDI8_LEPPY|nr:hypothetical protein ABB37_08242 [Leptomonas pyrrhocoris]XP_015654121.1 hypothetical protein ABB37_08242 [Leptomonas pyrrhocoris]KPA75681.1 hypothetical protein ABB37_08242 [Leptomonas pyrrhocoris]KPA75682.1 hypothetical protein ABB37_08242 [Leptomonas pyrrhocoris]|eukprot:XP_015654120.1 hypothetical protein ABB37_08242 [Leptomonas pyrrhocoris]
MNIYTFVSFFYGSVGGALSCIVFFFVAFSKIESLLSKTVRKKARKHAEFDAVAKEAAVVAAAKVETLCKMARFDDGIVSEAIQCRMVFYSGTIDIYAVDELRTLPDHRQEVVKEHMLGRINRACVVATGERISKYHRHRNTSTRYAAVKGKCTIVKHKDGAPLFLEDPAVLLKDRLRALKKKQHQQATVDRLRRHALRDGVTMTVEQALAQMREAEAAANTHTILDQIATAACAVGGRGDVLGFCEPYRRPSLSGPTAAVKDKSKRRGSTNSVVEDVPLSQWTCLAIKFPTRRVQERWLNLLQATPLSSQWHDFIQHLPKMDVFNLLIARLFFENSRANTLHDLLEEKLRKKLERAAKSLPQRLRGNIYLDALDVGGEIPFISNVSDPTSSLCGDTEFDFDVLYRGGFALKIRFAICYRDIRVPDIVFSIKVLELAGRMRFVVGPPPTKKFWLGCPRPPQLRLDFTQEVASHDGILNTVLKLLPDMSQVASNVVTSLFFEDMVFPSLDDFPWPVLGAHDDDDDDTDHDGTDAPKTASDVDELEVIRHDGVVIGGPNQLPGERRENPPSFAVSTTPKGSQNSCNGDRSSSQDRHSQASPGMTSPPPRPPLSRRASLSSVEVPTRRASSSESRKTEGEEESQSSRQTPRPVSPPRRLPSRRDSTATLNTPPAGLPPRPPRAATVDVAKGIHVPTSRAPGSASFRVTHFSDFKEPDEEGK